MIGLKRYIIAAVILPGLMLACRHKEANVPVLFEALDDNQTGLHFNNQLTPTAAFNMFNYMYFYNGAGVGAGDFNNDSLVDLFFASNQGESKLFLNEGGLHFRDVTSQASLPQDKGWSTGVSVVDINNDGLLDIYVCKVGQYEILKAKNQLLVCKGIKDGVPYYEDEAAKYGLDFTGFSTQAAFLDYDRDGDLDMFLLNHAVHQNGSFAPRENFLGTYDSLSGDRLFRNDGGHFSNVTRESGINSSAIGYGLGIAVSDINLDGWPDIYIGNDFHENDYLYINQHNGTFADESGKALMHTSQFSMGVDVSDANNDGFPEIISMDMLPSDPYILKRSLGDNDYDIFNQKIAAGYSYQYSRNNLQYNRGNGLFSETGAYSGIYATDWSWAPLWMDFDNDGLKDLFVSNGIPKRLNDMDYINFIYSGDMQKKLSDSELKDKDMELINRFPEIKIPNKFFSNKKDLQFEDRATGIKNDKPTYSNGAVYADFDNDGDLDVVVNNINDPVLLYANRSNDKADQQYVSIKLEGPAQNKNAIGAKVFVYSDSGLMSYEKNPARGFMSSMETDMHIGLSNMRVDSAMLVWPDNTFQPIKLDRGQHHPGYKWQAGLPTFNYSSIKKPRSINFIDLTGKSGLQYRHQENPFNEFTREPLMPHMLTAEGPALAVADINHDGLEDVFVGASKTFHSAVFLQTESGMFKRIGQPQLEADSMYEDVDAIWADVNNDKNLDLIIASGGNEYYGTDVHMSPRLFLNDGMGNLIRSDSAFPNIYLNASSIAAYDFTGDGLIDLFIGGRSVPWKYGVIPSSYLLKNEGNGKFSDVTGQYAKDLLKEGMVTDGVWTDINKDGKADLVVCNEWGGIDAYMNNKNGFDKHSLIDQKGWWNFILPVDIDRDGDMDFIAGNLGLNTRLHASAEKPVTMYYNDFDDNGTSEQIMTYYLDGKEIVFANKSELEKRIPVLKKNYLHAEEFAKARPDQLFSSEKWSGSAKLKADFFANVVLINDGNSNFVVKELPWQAQLSTYRDAAVIDANGDDLPDILMGGNFYYNMIQMGRNDADFGTVLVNKGNGNFEYSSVNPPIRGQIRYIGKISIGKKDAFVVARNNDSLIVIGK